ncbi:hypothetical protein DINM_005124 [Dirofilaria immitis]|nr:hypothetical protein [Dirofilaria immitis]
MCVHVVLNSSFIITTNRVAIMTSLASEERYATLLEWFDGMVSGWRDVVQTVKVVHVNKVVSITNGMITFIGVLLVLLSFLNMKAADILVMSCSLFPVHRFAMRIFAERVSDDMQQITAWLASIKTIPKLNINGKINPRFRCFGENFTAVIVDDFHNLCGLLLDIQKHECISEFTDVTLSVVFDLLHLDEIRLESNKSCKKLRDHWKTEII